MTTSIQKDALLSQFAVLAYQDETFLSNSANLPSGWKLIDQEVKSPFAAFAFKDESTGEVIVAYRGTNGLSDLAADTGILFGSWDTQFKQGIDFLDQIRTNTQVFSDGYDPAKVFVTGHSLGGAIAQVTAQAFGLDGSTIDAGAAQRIAQTPEFRAAAIGAGLPEAGLGVASTFTNHLVVGSTVSDSTGPHIGQVSYIPSLTFSGEQVANAFLVGQLNPVAGFAYAIVTDQFSNKHSSVQVSEAVQLMAGAGDAGTVGASNLILTRTVVRWTPDPVTGIDMPVYSQTEFEIRNGAGELQSTVKFSGSDTERQFDVFDAAGELMSTTTLSPGGAVTVHPVRGDSMVITYLPESQTNLDGTVTTIYRTPDGSVLSTGTTIIYDDGSTNETVHYADGRITRTTTDDQGTVSSSADIQYVGADGSSVETVTYADGRIVKLIYDGEGNLLSQQEIASGASTLQKAIGNYGSTLIDALSLIKAIQSGEPLPVVSSGLRLANDVSTLNGMQDLNLSGTAYTASGILSLMSLDAALERGDSLGAVTAAAQAVNFGATAYANFAGYSGNNALQSAISAGEFGAAGDAIGVISEALPYLNLINAIANGDETGVAVAVASYFVPGIGWAYAVYSIIDSLFSGDADIPDPWGTGRYVWTGDAIAYEAAGETGGKEAVESVMGSVIATLNALIEIQRQQNPGSQLGIIPNRMPTVGYDMSGFRYTDIDPLTGAEQHPALRFDTSGRPYNAEPGSPESYQSIVEAMARSALLRGAIAPLWEVRTASMQTGAGDPKAGLTEEERASRDGLLAAQLSGTTQSFRPVALDLDGDGIDTRSRADGVAFDVDDSGYLKQTAWIGGDDAMLVLDRDYNGQFDSGRELFSNADVALSRRGLAGMAWMDADYDGRLTAVDPVWDELRVWRDVDQDGAQDTGEVQGLDALGISELNYAMGTFTRNGARQQLASPDLEADRDGTRVTVVPEGILIQASSDGHLSLLVTRVDDKSALDANRDGLTGYEDVEIIVSSADLLANDTLGGFTGRDLTIVGLTGFRHGSGFIDANGFIHFTPEANHAGEGAGFDYIVRAASGQEGTASVDITLQNVNDAPTLETVEHTEKPIYGYSRLLYIAPDENNDRYLYSYGGVPYYEPYAIQRNADGDETVIYNPPAGRADLEYHITPVATEDSGAGRIRGTDIDDPAASLTYDIVSQPQYGTVSLNADGSFQYTSWKEPGVASDRIVIDGQYAATEYGMLFFPGNLPDTAVYPSTDVFQVRVTDPQGASTIQSVSVTHYGPYLPTTPSGGGGKKPIAVDLGGDGFTFVSVDDSNVFFDVNGDGWKRRTAWIGKDDGLLACDIDGDGKIDQAGEIGFARYKDGAQSDLEGLSAFDSNGDGRFDAGDDDWAKFGVWQDADQDGVTDAGEFRSLAAMGVAAVELTSDGRFEVVNGQTVHGVGSMAMTDGSRLAIADVTLAFTSETQVPQADGTTSTIDASPFSPDGEQIDGTDGKDLILGKSGNNIVNGLAGDDIIFEDGGNDIIDAGDGNDLVYAGADNDLVMGGMGDDVVYAGQGSDAVFGGDGHDAVFADDGNDVVFGGTGNDLLSGGAGNDVLSGDDGDDQVYGEAGYDALFGRDGNDELSGMEGNDRLDGGNGDDLLDGGGGADEMIGGDGDDTYVLDDAADTVLELAAAGTDTVSTALDACTLGANVENLALTGAADLAASGNELDNMLTGNRGNNTLAGGAGNDRLDGGLGSDMLAGGTGDDTCLVDNARDVVVEAAGEGIDTVEASVSHALSANVENLILTGSAAINATGNELDNRLGGNAGDNLLDGGAGADAMAGGDGNDDYIVDNSADTVVEAAFGGVDTIYAGISYVLPEHVENLVLTGDGKLGAGGNDLDNRLTGNGGDNAMSGGAGNDMLDGGAGNDTYLINAGDGLDRIDDAAGMDTVQFGTGLSLANVALRVTQEDGVHTAHVRVLNGGGCEQPDQGFDFVVAVDQAGRTSSPIEQFRFADGSIATFDELLITTRVTHGAPSRSTITTGRDDDIIVAGPRSNVIRAGSGNDIVFSGRGGDTVSGEGGDDYLQGGAGNDTLDGGCGIDVLAGSNGSDMLRDLGDRNALLGGRQNDRIEAGAGNDFIAGGMHDDTIQAGGGHNVIAFNRNDGRDVVLPSLGAVNTLSLGGGIDERDLRFQKSGQDLLLATGGGGQITLQGWYASPDNRNVANLQLIVALPHDSHGQACQTGRHIDTFDFGALVARFDAARLAHPRLSQWSLMNGLLDAHLDSSDSAALGGELAARYASGGESAISLDTARDTLQDARFAYQAQTVGSRFDTSVHAYRLA